MRRLSKFQLSSNPKFMWKILLILTGKGGYHENIDGFSGSVSTGKRMRDV